MKSKIVSGLAGFIAIGASLASACSSTTDEEKFSASQQGLEQAQGAARLTQPALVRARADARFAPDVLSQLQSKRRAQVIISFDVPELALPNARLYDHPNRAQALAGIRDGADRLIRALGAPAVHRRFDSVNAVALALDENALDLLLGQPQVTSVILDQPGSGNLLEAVPLSKLDVVQAAGFTGAGVAVAVVDSGIDRTHPDLSDALIGEACFCSGSAPGDGVGCCPNGQDTQTGSGAAADDNGHGTNVSGIVTSNGTVAPKGGAPGANLVVVKVLDASNSFNFSSDVIAGFDWIATNRHDVKLVNASLGTFTLYAGSSCDANADAGPWKTVVDTLRSNGVLLFASSGNQSSSTSLALPACVSNTIAVGAVWDSNVGQQSVFCTDTTTAADKITCFTNSSAALDLLAPGAPMTSTGLGGFTSTFYGTSQASPLAAACAALLLQRTPTLSPSQLEAALKTSATRITDARNGLNFPRLDCQAALASSGGSSSPLPRTGWTATASATGGADVPARALDGNATSRWTTGVHQTPGQFFVADMKTAQTFNQVTLDSGADFARGYQLFVSNDGINFGSAVASGTASPTIISFSTQTARFIKIVQTSNTSPQWWSIQELNVFAPAAALPRTGWVASASASSASDTPAKAIDSSLSSRFSTGAVQTTGQWFQVDMQSAKTFSKLTLDAGASTGDFPHGFQVFVSNDGLNWGSAIATGSGATQLVTITFAPKTARFVRVQLTASFSPNWWSIADFNVVP